jgi:hypothetical protein
MPKRRSTILVAHADGVPIIAFTNEQWQAIEDAYGRQLNAEVRQQITTVTTRYLKDCVFERTAAPKEMVRERIERIRRRAGDLETMLGPEAFSASFDELSIEQRQSAHSYADSLIRRHLVPSPHWAVDSQRHVRPDLMSHIANIIDAQLDSFDAQCNRQRLARDKLHHLRSALKSLVVASSCALNDLSAAAEGHHGKGMGLRHGKLELLDAPVIWETVDPKTGKTVSGTREEIDAVLGERGGRASSRAGRPEREAGNRRHEMSGSEAAARERRRSDCPF